MSFSQFRLLVVSCCQYYNSYLQFRYIQEETLKLLKTNMCFVSQSSQTTLWPRHTWRAALWEKDGQL